ncbi:MAG TPA: ABC transporter permease, partial [Terracidiphilus sp.]|nr:ABC transporter permease [Terracidiphilus sp.]
MRNMLLIARREYLEQVRGRAFRMTTFGLPTVFALIVGVGYLSSLGLGANRRIAVLSNDLALATQIRSQLVGNKDARAHVQVVAPATEADLNAFRTQVKDGSLDGVLWVNTVAGKAPTASYASASSGDFITTARMNSALNHALLDEKLMGGGMKQDAAETLVKGVDLQTFQVKKDGAVVKSSAEASFWKGYVMAILLSMTTMIYGMNVARSIIQEKTSRIFEVMLSIAKPSDLLAGKLIGVAAVGLTQIGIWLIAGAAILFSPFAAAMLTGQFAVHFTWTEAILFPVYFLLGYLLYSSLFAGLAATCETEQELQMYMPLAAAPTWLSFA